jgi:hypothetical protein
MLVGEGDEKKRGITPLKRHFDLGSDVPLRRYSPIFSRPDNTPRGKFLRGGGAPSYLYSPLQPTKAKAGYNTRAGEGSGVRQKQDISTSFLQI